MSNDQPIETIKLDEIPDDLSGLGEANQPEEAPYRTLLELWRAVLEPSNEVRKDPVSPQWAVKMVTMYPGVGFGDVEGIHHGVFDMAAEMAAILNDEIDGDDECLKKLDAAEDAEQNSRHYKDLLAAWQIYILREELAWRPSDRDAAAKLAVLSEVQQMFLGETGLVAHLEQIGFQFDDADKAELQQRLIDAREEALTGGDGE